MTCSGDISVCADEVRFFKAISIIPSKFNHLKDKKIALDFVDVQNSDDKYKNHLRIQSAVFPDSIFYNEVFHFKGNVFKNTGIVIKPGYEEEYYIFFPTKITLTDNKVIYSHGKALPN